MKIHILVLHAQYPYFFSHCNINMNNLYICRVSIVMAYHNRKSQTLITLDTIEKSAIKDIEVIIVDDGSNDENRLNDIIHNYSFRIKLFRIEPDDKHWVNPCVPYNLGFKHACGDIIIIQNPEVCHINDIISYTVNNLKSDQYLVYSCYALPSFDHNNELAEISTSSISDNLLANVNNYINTINYENYAFDWEYYIEHNTDLNHIKTYDQALAHWNSIGNKEGRKCNKSGIHHPNEYIAWKGWYNHPTYHPRPLHFLSATYKQNIDKIKGFNENYSQGYWYDDDDFLHRLKNITNVEIVDSVKTFGIHLYHLSGSADMIKDINVFTAMCDRNKQLYNTLVNSNTNMHDWTPSADIGIINPTYHIYNNYVLDNIKIGIGITTYSDEKTSDTRIKIIDDSLSSLRKTLENKPIDCTVIVVVDGSVVDKHRSVLNKYADIFRIVYKPKNTGIGAAKNTCINLLLKENIDYGFLADDDMLYKDNWYKAYCSYMMGTDIQHLIFFPLKYFEYDTVTKIHKHHKVVDLDPLLSGCFITFTEETINKVGYFRVLPYKYGHEHCDFTMRCLDSGICPYRTDIYESSYFLDLHPDSIVAKSIEVDYDGVEKNGKCILDGNIFVDFNDGL